MDNGKPITIDDFRAGKTEGPCTHCPKCGRVMIWDRPADDKRGYQEWICAACLSTHEGILAEALRGLVSAMIPKPDTSDGRDMHGQMVHIILTGHIAEAARRLGLDPPTGTPIPACERPK